MTSPIPLRAGETSLVLDVSGPGLPVVLHWGADLGESATWPEGLTDPPLARSALDAPVPLSLLPERSAGWRGRPGLTGDSSRERWSTAFALHDVRRKGAGRVVVAAADEVAGLSLRTELELAASGVLRMRHILRNESDTPYAVQELACVLPLPGQAEELLDLTGRWCRELHPQRLPLVFGAHVREDRHGRTGHDATLVLAAGTPGFGFRHGEVWGVHLAWSGDHTTYAERLPDGRAVIGAAELLGPGEVVLAPGDEYATPELLAAYSVEGLDGLSRVFHGWARARPRHPRSPRPVVLNTWEAVYFRHDLHELTELADVAAQLGVERFVLDDGWFRRRRDDSAGLGDWYVDDTVWPQGLGPLIEQVRARGMEFGLWVEPEMVNPNSDLYRAHPEWILSSGGRVPPTWRGQQVLDLSRPEVCGYLLERLDALLSEYDISFLKWDHNRDLVEPGHEGRPAVHGQTLAAYRLLDELRARHPGVEIESCASGGARVDLGILARTDRVWASDTNDALERQSIQRWTGLLLPPELVGSHVGPPTAHTTGRTHALSFRVGTALFGHFGLEWDVRQASGEERGRLAASIAFYKQHRALLHSGDVVRADLADASTWLHGVVASDLGDALFAFVQLATSAGEVPVPVRLPGLDPERSYRVEPVTVAGWPALQSRTPPPWLAAGGITASGRLLGTVGLSVPALMPEQLLLLYAHAT
jgi:alpha-galactosidase